MPMSYADIYAVAQISVETFALAFTGKKKRRLRLHSG